MIARIPVQRWSAVFALAILSALTPALITDSRAEAAGTYELVTCNFQNVTDQTYGKWNDLSGGEGAEWAVVTRCPSEVEFQLTSADASADSWRGFSFPAENSTANTIKSLSFDLLGSDGSDGNLDQFVTVCSPTMCSGPIRTSGPNVSTPEHHSLTAADLPPAANEVRLIGRCNQPGGCIRARPLKLRNLAITFADAIAPSIEPSEVAITPGLPPLVPFVLDEQNTWHSARVTPRVRLNVAAADFESGVQYVQFDFFRLDTFPPTNVGRSWENEKLCGTAQQQKIGALCPKRLNSEMRIEAMGATNNFGIREGLNRVVAVAYDAAGNKSQGLSTEFLVDSVAPSLRVTSPLGAETHWRGEPVAHIEWQNTGEGGESNYDSGLAGARWEVRDAVTNALRPDFAGEATGYLNRLEAVALPGDGVWKVSVSTFDAAGNTSSTGPQQSTTIGVDSTVLDEPEVGPIRPQGAAEVAAGIDVEWQAPANSGKSPSGICGYAIAVDQSSSTDPGLGADAKGSDLDAKVSGEFVDGENFLHMRAITCAGVGGRIAHTSFVVDTGAPEVAISSPGPAGWYSELYPLSASIASGGGEGASMALSLDSATLEFAPVAKIAAPQVDGTFTLVAAAQDSVGNRSTLTSEVRIDSRPPRVEIAPINPLSPTRVRVIASDGGSGVTVAGVEYRGVGSSDWRAAASERRPPLGVAGSFAFEESLPDLEMPDGTYEIRAFARDNAGHLVESEGARTVRLPLRRAPSITAEFSRESKGRERVETRDFAFVGLGHGALMRGQLNAASGEPLGDTRIEIFESAIGRPPTRVGTATTDSSGRFAYSVLPGTSRRVLARYGGDGLNLPAETVVRFLVRPRVTLKVQHRRLRDSNRVTFTGTVAAPGADWPRTGLPVKIEFRPRGRAGAVSIAGKAASNGRFSITSKFRRTDRPLRFTVRAVVPWQTGWAYERGQSKQRKFVIR